MIQNNSRSQSFRLAIKAFYLGEEGESPEFAALDVSRDFLSKVASYAALARAAGFRSAHIEWSREVWSDPDPENALNMGSTDLVVMPSYGATQDIGIFFQAKPKHASYQCETQVVLLSDLTACLEGDCPQGYSRRGGVLFATTWNMRELQEAYFSNPAQGPFKDDEVWWSDPCRDLSSGIYTVISADHPDFVVLRNDAGSCSEVPRQEITQIDVREVAEWVGMHYRVNFDTEPDDCRADWIGRWVRTQRGQE